MGALKSKFRKSKSGKEEKPGKGSKKKTKAVNLPESQSARKTVDPRLPFSNYRQIFSLRNAWKAVSRTMEDCAKETLLKLWRAYPDYKAGFSSVKDINDEEELRHNEDFENIAMDVYQVFDEVIANLEAVDNALKDIERAAKLAKLTRTMWSNYHDPFIEVIQQTLGSDRFTETTEDNFKLLYSFIEKELGNHLPEETPADGVEATEVEVNLCSDET